MGMLNIVPFFRLCVFFLVVLIFCNSFSLTTALDGKMDDENGNTGNIANETNGQPPESMGRSRITTPFKPSIAIIVGVLTTIFSITFLLLLYVKHCKRATYVNTSRGYPPSRNHSGINRKVIESLPMFRFSSLRGQKDGLECAVCLNKFEPDEVLRLLPKCKHAFHVECVDTWLDAHSTCPLCRYRVHPEDVLLVVDYHDNTRSLFNNHETPRHSDYQGKSVSSPVINGNPRISGRHSSAAERGRSMEIIVENPGEDFRGRVSLDSWNSRRKTKNVESEHFTRRPATELGKSGGQVAENPGRRSLDSWKSLCMKTGHESRKDGQLLVLQNGDKHRLEHRIIISGKEAAADGQQAHHQQQRWSDVQPSEFLYLRSEMILSEKREEEEEEEGRSGRGVINERSVSEITGMSRYRRSNEREERERKEEGVVKRWLAWISQSQQYKHQKPAVQSATPSSSSSPPSSIVV